MCSIDLELTYNPAEELSSKYGIPYLDLTVTPMGARRLSQWLRYPLQDQARIEARLDAVEFFKDNGLLRQRWRQTLKGLGDLERLTARVALEQASFDLVNKAAGLPDAFRHETGVSGLRAIERAEELGLGRRKYRLIELK